MADNIEIFLCLHGAQISFLSIPRSDIDRLAVYPFRWLRYVMFAICGARGDLSTPNGILVDYDVDNTKFAGNAFYYWPLEYCVFTGHQGLPNKSLSTNWRARRHKFRDDVIRRDGHACVVTNDAERHCDVVHLIPWSKGDKYIERVIQCRSSGDDSSPPLDVWIDDMRNGVLLSKTVHSRLHFGEVAFIKTPNYGLGPEHIKRFQRGDLRQDYITLHWLKEPEDYDPTMLTTLQTQIGSVKPGAALAAGANVDALFQGEGGSLPSTIILDYAYGAAAYQTWKSGDDSALMKQSAEHQEIVL